MADNLINIMNEYNCCFYQALLIYVLKESANNA